MATNIQERLNSRTYVQDGHLLWGGTLDATGYGRISVGNQKVSTHRLAWNIACGEIPKGLCVLHTCDTPPCILPWHLYLGTQLDNAQDRSHAGNHHGTNKTHCKYGHEFTEENTYLRRNGARACRACHNARQRQRYKASR